MELANETKIKPGQKPNKAPANNVLSRDMGKAKAVTTT